MYFLLLHVALPSDPTDKDMVTFPSQYVKVVYIVE